MPLLRSLLVIGNGSYKDVTPTALPEDVTLTVDIGLVNLG
jgi:hypothetical protein